MNKFKNLFEESERSMMHKKLSLGLANVAVIKAWDILPEPIHKCPDCNSSLMKRSFWNWFRSGYNSEGYNLPEGKSLISIGSTLMCGMISNKCSKCGKVIRTKDLDKGIERFSSGKAYKSIFSKQL